MEKRKESEISRMEDSEDQEALRSYLRTDRRASEERPPPDLNYMPWCTLDSLKIKASPIGEGSYSTVHKAYYKEIPLALKLFRLRVLSDICYD